MPDEQLFHRIGMIPIQSDGMELIELEKCECSDACNRFAYKFKIDKINGEELRSDDLILTEDYNELISKNIYLMQLKNNHVVQLRGYVRRGVEANHSKYSPASAIEIEFNENDYTLVIEFIEEIGNPLLIVKRAVEILKEKIYSVE